VESLISKKLRLTGSDPTRYHVIPQKSNWAVKREGTQRATKIVSTRDSAISFASRIAITLGSTGVTVHRADGTIQKRIPTTAIKKSKKTRRAIAKKKK